MSRRAIFKMVDSITGWVEKAESRFANFSKGLGEEGSRLAPTKAGDNDERIGGRIDHGRKFMKDGIWYRRYDLQANKNAKDATIKSLSQKNSHAKIAATDVPMETAEESKRPDIKEIRRAKFAAAMEDLKSQVSGEAQEEEGSGSQGGGKKGGKGGMKGGSGKGGKK